jgi:hypothetical protein
MSRRGGRGGGNSRSSVSVSKELLKRSASEAGLDDRHLKVLTDITRPPLFPDFLWRSTGKYWTEEDRANNETGRPATESRQVSATKRPASVISLINKHREITKRFQNGPYYVRPAAVVDIVRYSDRQKNQTMSTPDTIVLASFSKSNHTLATDQRYFPTELLNLNDRKKRTRKTPALTASAAIQPSHQPSMKSFDDMVVVKLEELAHEESSSSATISGIRVDHVTSNASTNTTAANETAPDDDEEEEDGLAPIQEDEEEGEDYTTNYYNTDDESDHDDDGEPTY